MQGAKGLAFAVFCRNIMDIPGIIIGGASRAGKSILAGRLCQELGLTHVPVDPMVDAFAAVYPSSGIAHTSEEYQKVSANLGPFLFKFLSRFPYLYERYAADSVYFEPETLKRISVQESVEVLFLGYPACTPDDKLALIRRFERPKDWTRNFPDREMKIFVQRYIDRSKYLRDECHKHGVRFVDTSEKVPEVLEAEVQRMLSLFGNNNRTQ